MQRGLRRGDVRVQLAKRAAAGDRVVLPAQLPDHNVSRREAGVSALDHLTDHLTRHRLADLGRLRVRARFAHARAHVWVEREPLRADEHLTRSGLRDLRLDEREVRLLRESDGPRGERDLSVHAAHRSNGAPEEGVPWWKRRGRPSGSPASYTVSERPSVASIVSSSTRRAYKAAISAAAARSGCRASALSSPPDRSPSPRRSRRSRR